MLHVLQRAMRPLRGLVSGARLVEAGRAIERARLGHELRLRALFWQLACLGLEPRDWHQNFLIARELEKLADRFTAPSCADKMPQPGRSNGVAPLEQNGTAAGRVAPTKTAARGFPGSGASAPDALGEPAQRENGRRRDPGAARRVTR